MTWMYAILGFCSVFYLHAGYIQWKIGKGNSENMLVKSIGNFFYLFLSPPIFFLTILIVLIVNEVVSEHAMWLFMFYTAIVPAVIGINTVYLVVIHLINKMVQKKSKSK